MTAPRPPYLRRTLSTALGSTALGLTALCSAAHALPSTHDPQRAILGQAVHWPGWAPPTILGSAVHGQA